MSLTAVASEVLTGLLCALAHTEMESELHIQNVVDCPTSHDAQVAGHGHCGGGS